MDQKTRTIIENLYTRRHHDPIQSENNIAFRGGCVEFRLILLAVHLKHDLLKCAPLNTDGTGTKLMAFAAEGN